MGERCSLQGKQRDIQPSKGTLDDESLSFADLATRGAQRVTVDAAEQALPVPIAEVRGYATLVVPIHEEVTQLMEAFADLVPPTSPEADPFGFNQVGLSVLAIVSDEVGADPGNNRSGHQSQCDVECCRCGNLLGHSRRPYLWARWLRRRLTNNRKRTPRTTCVETGT